MIFTSSTFLYTWIHTFKDKKERKKESVKELTVPSLCSSFKLKEKGEIKVRLFGTLYCTLDVNPPIAGFDCECGN